MFLLLEKLSLKPILMVVRNIKTLTPTGFLETFSEIFGRFDLPDQICRVDITNITIKTIKTKIFRLRNGMTAIQ